MKPAKRFLINGVNRSSGPEVFCIKMYCNTGVFLWVLRNFKNTFLTEHLQVTASAKKTYEKSYVLSCQRALRAYVLTCSRANMSCVLTCSRANVPCVLSCPRAHVRYVLKWWRVLHATSKNKKWVFNDMFSLDFW